MSSQQIRGQHPDHVINVSKSEASIKVPWSMSATKRRGPVINVSQSETRSQYFSRSSRWLRAGFLNICREIWSLRYRIWNNTTAYFKQTDPLVIRSYSQKSTWLTKCCCPCCKCSHKKILHNSPTVLDPARHSCLSTPLHLAYQVKKTYLNFNLLGASGLRKKNFEKRIYYEAVKLKLLGNSNNSLI